MKINFYGASEIVTGSSYLLEIPGYKLLIDCGMFQGSKVVKELNYGIFPYDPKTIDAVILTHAHVDHSGLIPKLIKNGYTGPIYTTPETIEFCKVMFPDSGHIQEMEVERKNRKLNRANGQLLKPIYTAEEGLNATKSFIPIKYEESVLLSPNISATFIDAGHILGSAHVVLNVTEGEVKTKVVFSGDIGTANQPYLEEPSRINEADLVIMETTYGNRTHEDKSNREDILAEVINTAHAKGGNIIIPAFAVERTQDILFFLDILQTKKRIPIMPIYVDSPLAVAATRIFAKNTQNFDDESLDLIKSGNNPLSMKNLHFSETTADSIGLNNLTQASIIISASGMADAGRIKHHLKHNLWRSNATIIFVGYQAEGSLGRRLIEGAKEVTIHGEKVAVNAEIVNLLGFSAHADQNELLSWIKRAGKLAKNIILVHGEIESIHSFSQTVEQNFGKTPIIPVLGESIEFKKDEVIRVKPQVPWLQEIGDKLALAQTGGVKKMGEVRTVIGGKVKDSKKITFAEVNESYVELRENLRSIIDTARSEKDYSHLMEIFKHINKILDESFYKK